MLLHGDRSSLSPSRILRNFVLAELLLFLMVANCAPSRPREDAGRVPGNPASYPPSLYSSSRSISSSSSSSSSSSGNSSNGSGRSNFNRRGGNAAAASSSSAVEVPFIPKDADAGFGRRTYRWSTGCSYQPGGGLLRLLPKGGVDARGVTGDPDAEIELSSLGPDGKVYIISAKRKLYLCFTKKGKLITRQRPGVDKTLCQFYETSIHSNRHFINVYRRHHQRQQQKKSQHHQQQQPIMWPIPIPGQSVGSWNEPGPLGAIAASVDMKPVLPEPEDWQVGFDQSGEPLKGSAWRSDKHRRCFDLAEHVDHVRPAVTVQPSPVDSNMMIQIFKSENNVPLPSRTVLDHQPATPASKPKKSQTAAGKNSKHEKNTKSKSSSSSKNSLSRSHHHKGGSSSSKRRGSEESDVDIPSSPSDSWRTGLSGAKRQSNKISGSNSNAASSGSQRSRQREERPKPKIEPPKGRPSKAHPASDSDSLELWKLDERYKDDNEANVDFDSYLAETEEMLAHPAEVIASSDKEEGVASANAAAATVDSAVEYSAAAVAPATAAISAQRTAFIQRDSGGWEEVIVNDASSTVAITPILNEEEDDDLSA